MPRPAGQGRAGARAGATAAQCDPRHRSDAPACRPCRCPAARSGRELVHPAQGAARSPSKPEGLAALLHAIAHIEFNAINLALDAAWRFDGMPRGVPPRLAAGGGRGGVALHAAARAPAHRWATRYGDFAAHDGLWTMCEKTAGRRRRAHGAGAAHAGGARPRRHAADPGTSCARSARRRRCARWRSSTSSCATRVGHVAIGNHWYRWLCARDGLDPVAHYERAGRALRRAALASALQR